MELKIIVVPSVFSRPEYKDISLGMDMRTGWGNGYVLLPPEHLFYNLDYNQINEFVSVHGALTFGNFVSRKMINNEYWSKYLTDEDHRCKMIGFDTAHYGDTPEIWTMEAVYQETHNLRVQCQYLDDQILDRVNLLLKTNKS